MTDTPEVPMFDNSGAEALIDEIRAAFADVPFPFDFLIGKEDEFIQWLQNVFNEKSKVAKYIPSPWMSEEKMYSVYSEFSFFSHEEAKYVFPRLLIDILTRSMHDPLDAAQDAKHTISLLDINSHLSLKQQKSLIEDGLEDWMKAFNAARPGLAEFHFSPFQTFSSRQIAVVVQWLQFLQRWSYVDYYEEYINSALDFWQAYHTRKSNIKFNS